MYTLLGIDAVLRITAALLFLFVAVPALMRAKPQELDRMEWFWWCLAAGTTALTLIGQGLTLFNIYSTVTLLLIIAATILIVRARVTRRSPQSILYDLYRATVLFSLNALENRVNVRRRLRRVLRRARARLAHLPSRPIAGWTALIAIAAAIRLYRPFATANLGFSDTYVHLYLMRLLEQGRQVDPAWGPYPRGMHFLLYAIHELTNVDMILLMNFFGPIAGVLMTIAVAHAARRLSGSLRGGLFAGLLFATMIGGGSQYFILGGSMATDRVDEARAFVRMTYAEIPPTSAEFDVLLTAFQRQTATLPQELAIVFLFPAVMFLMRTSVPRNLGTSDAAAVSGRGTEVPRYRGTAWALAGFFFCTSSIAAIHPGVAVPLVLLCIVTVIAARPDLRTIVRWAITGALGILLGSTWMLGYIAYPRFKASADASGASSTAAYYFPFLREGDVARIVTYVAVTPFLIACLVIAIALLVRALVKRERAMLWTSLAAILFTITHVASRFALPEVVEVRRNASWLAMTLAILIGVAFAELLRTRAWKPIAAAVLVAWLWRVPLAGAHEKLINYSGYSGTAYAVLEIQRKHEPFTWTLITYGQEFPMVLGKGFHLAAADFLDRYDPGAQKLDIPTPYVFIAVEKQPHHFQINTWSRFTRADLERRLQTWCFLYQLQHRDMRVFHDDENVRVYVIEKKRRGAA
jgi:hypothetical protein